MLEDHVHFPDLGICASRLGPDFRTAYWRSMQESRNRLGAQFERITATRMAAVEEAMQLAGVETTIAEDALRVVWNSIDRTRWGEPPDEQDAVNRELWEEHAEAAGEPVRTAQSRFTIRRNEIQRDLMQAVHDAEEAYQAQVAAAQETYAGERRQRLEDMVRRCEELP